MKRTKRHFWRKDPMQRIKEKIVVDSNSCWIWQGAKSIKGYGRMQYKDTRWLVHRLAYTLFYGKLLANQGGHKCEVKSCCNPEHIEDQTNSQNIQQWYDNHFNRR